MQFSSITFLIFFALVFILYWSSPCRFQNAVLVVANLIFYACWDIRFVFLLSFLILIIYKGALLIQKAPSQRVRKYLLIVCLFISIGTLFFFKYFNFFIDNFNALLNIMGIHSVRHISIILPIGLSYYTFLLSSYIIDVYRKTIEPTNDFISFFAFSSFFPTILAGPIERAGNLLKQLGASRVLSYERFQDAIWLICWGLVKKIVMADQLNSMIAPVINNPSGFIGSEIIVMIFAFTFQIYLDFSSYSDIAMGLAKLLGLDIILNFNLPYLSRNPQQFWRHWHISLSTWLRDYIYISLGGNRKGETRTYINLIITMLIGGLWHGAAWNYILWGVYHGLLLSAHRLWSIKIGKIIRVPCFIATVSTFLYISYGWLLFKANSFDQIKYFTIEIFSNVSLTIRCLMWIQDLGWTILPLIMVVVWQCLKKELLLSRSLNWWTQSVIYGIFFYLFLTVGIAAKTQEFIYFQY